MTKKNLLFTGTIQRDRGSEYTHAEIRVFPNMDRPDSRDWIEFTWQGDNERDKWYAFRVNIEAHSVDELNAKIRMARKVMGDGTEFFTTPDAILDRLEKIATETVYDARVSEFVSLTEIMPESVKAWRDDYYTMGNSSCKVGCLAKTKEEAQDLILLELARSSHYHEYLQQWLNKGRPVRMLDDRMPDTRPTREKLALSSQNDNQ